MPGSAGSLVLDRRPRRRFAFRCDGLPVRISRPNAGIPVQLIAGFQKLAQIEVGAQVIGGRLLDRRGGRFSVVGDDGAVVRRVVVSFIDADQKFVFAQADVVAVLEHVVMVLAERNLGAVDIGAVRTGIHQDVVSRPEIDPGVFA